MTWLTVYLFGVYIGMGVSIGAWFYLDDDPWEDERHWVEDVLMSAVIAFVWGPLFAAIIASEEI